MSFIKTSIFQKRKVVTDYPNTGNRLLKFKIPYLLLLLWVINYTPSGNRLPRTCNPKTSFQHLESPQTSPNRTNTNCIRKKEGFHMQYELYHQPNNTFNINNHYQQVITQSSQN